MFGKTYTHEPLTGVQESALNEIAVIDALRVGLVTAQIRAGENGVRAGWLDRFDIFLANRKRGLMRHIEDAGIMYTVIDGEIRPLMVRAQEGRMAG